MVDISTQLVLPKSHQHKVIGIVTTGTEIYGMNAAVRASVLLANYIGSQIYIIHKGFSGLIEGGDNLILADWKNVSDIIYRGGSVFGTGNSDDFNTREARLEGAYNLIMKKITYLIVIGGTMSMLLSDLLKNEWKAFLDELYEAKRITKSQMKNTCILNIIYLPSSIDNFFGSDFITIGRDTALHRIIQTIDDIGHTGNSDGIFILEVIGIKNGYLALVAALCCEVDYIFIPEYPPKSDWAHRLCDHISVERRKYASGYNIILMSQNAIDFNGNRIKPIDVKNIIFQKIQKEAHIIALGDLQRGGNPSAFDSILATRLGAEAVLHLVNSTEKAVSSVMTLDDNKIITIPLADLMKRSEALSDAIAKQNWELALRLSGQTFENKLQKYLMLRRKKPSKNEPQWSESYRLGVICVGSPACGINGIIEYFVRVAMNKGHTVFGIQNGIEGLLSGHIKQMSWREVSRLIANNGICLGIKRMLPIDKYKEIAARFLEFNLQGLLIIGGFEAYYTCLLLSGQRSRYPEFCIPLIVIPATISNNVPGTELSVGSDTALNEITKICNKISSTLGDLYAHVFILEIMGGNCGYLTTMGGLAVGAEATYIYEEKFKIQSIRDDINHFMSKISYGKPRLLVMCHEKSSVNYNIDIFRRAFAEESNGLYEVSTNVLGHVQQSGKPSPFDRILGSNMATMSVEWLITQIKRNTNSAGIIQSHKRDSACILGLIGRQYKITPVGDFIDDIDFQTKLPRKQWWVQLRPLLKLLSNRCSAFPNGVTMTKEYTVCEEGIL